MRHKGGNAVQIGKSALCFLLEHSGLNAIARAYIRDSVLVLSYHGVISDTYAQHPLRLQNMVTVSEFEQHIDELRRLFAPVTLRDVRNWIIGSGCLPERAVLVTFDDGYTNSLTHAIPVLCRANVPAVFFLPTGYIGGQRVLWPTELYLRIYTWRHSRVPLPLGGDVKIGNDHHSRANLASSIEELCKTLPNNVCTDYLCGLRQRYQDWEITETFGAMAREMFGFLDWDQVRQLHALGFELGSHSVEHPILSRISEERLAQELEISKDAIEREVGCECYCFAYPNGGARDFTSATAASVRDAGYDLAFTLTGQICDRSQSPVLLDRVWIPGGDGIAGFRTRTSGMFTKLKQLTGEC
jgi:peptidoglycan/xylan/chitin deacetylase (PgdA/CDA1 family)